MITENLLAYVRLVNKSWKSGKSIKSKLLDYISNPRAKIYNRFYFSECSEGDKVLLGLFNKMLINPSLENIELSVITLDSIYHTRLDNPFKTSHAIFELNQRIDFFSMIRDSGYDRRTIIDYIASINKRFDNNEKYIYSFATKFCSFISPNRFPIYDQYSSTLLYEYLKNLNCNICNQPLCRSNMGDYSYYISAYDCFIAHYRLDKFSYKEIDRFLWSYGKIIENSVMYEDEEIVFSSVSYIPIEKCNSLKVKLDIHLFAEGKTCDELLSDKLLGHGTNPPFVVKPLIKANGQTIYIKYNETTTIGSFNEMLFQSVWGNIWEDVLPNLIIYYYVDGMRVEIQDNAISLSRLLNSYLDREKSGHINVSIFVSEDAGQIDDDGKLQYYIRSHEAGKHKIPHVHVNVSGNKYEEPISIINGDPLVKNPKMPRKYLKQAKKHILDNKSKFMLAWNAKTDGLDIDLNNSIT